MVDAIGISLCHGSSHQRRNLLTIGRSLERKQLLFRFKKDNNCSSFVADSFDLLHDLLVELTFTYLDVDSEKIRAIANAIHRRNQCLERDLVVFNHNLALKLTQTRQSTRHAQNTAVCLGDLRVPI